MLWITFIFNVLKQFWLLIAGVFGVFLLGRNSSLARENEKLKSATREQEKMMEIQKRVLDVVQNTETVNLERNIERMRKNKL